MKTSPNNYSFPFVAAPLPIIHLFLLVIPTSTQTEKLSIDICKERKAQEITASRFLQAYKLIGCSEQGAVKDLLDKDFVTYKLDMYLERCKKSYFD